MLLSAWLGSSRRVLQVQLNCPSSTCDRCFFGSQALALALALVCKKGGAAIQSQGLRLGIVHQMPCSCAALHAHTCRSTAKAAFLRRYAGHAHQRG